MATFLLQRGSLLSNGSALRLRRFASSVNFAPEPKYKRLTYTSICQYKDSKANRCVCQAFTDQNIIGVPALKSLEQILTAKDILVMQLEIPLEIVLQAIDIAHQKGATILIDPAPGQHALPLKLLQVDIITPNRGEAAGLTASDTPWKAPHG